MWTLQHLFIQNIFYSVFIEEFHIFSISDLKYILEFLPNVIYLFTSSWLFSPEGVRVHTSTGFIFITIHHSSALVWTGFCYFVSVLSMGDWNPHWFQIEYGMNSTGSGDTGESRWASGWFMWCCLIWRTSNSWSWLRCRTKYCKTVNHSISSQIVIMQRDSIDISDIICEGSWRSHSFDLLDVGGTVVKEGHAGEGMA